MNPEQTEKNIPKHIFRSYDARGVYGKDINEELFEKIGNAFAQYVKKDILIARDARTSSESLLNAFMNGALLAEKTVMNIGCVPLPAAVHWAVSQNFELAYITASHLPKEWNGVKFFRSSGAGFMEEENFAVRDLVVNGSYFNGLRAVPVREEIEDVLSLYVNRVAPKAKAENSKIKILIDCGNGTAGIIAKRLFEKAGFSADLLFDKPDGAFPNRLSDPVEDELRELKSRVKNYDFGIAYDGDADRFVVVARNGQKLATEQVAYVVLPELMKAKPGPVVANAECSMLLDEIAARFNTSVIRCKVGHTFLMDAVAKNNAVFGAESAGHYVAPSIAEFDDAVAVSLFFAYALHKSGRRLEEILKEIPQHHFERIDFECSDDKKFEVVEKVKQNFPGADFTDGLRVAHDDGFALVRASNTSPFVRLTISAKDRDKFESMKNEFRAIVERHL